MLFMAERRASCAMALRGPGDATIVPPTEDYDYISPGLIPEEIIAGAARRRSDRARNNEAEASRTAAA